MKYCHVPEAVQLFDPVSKQVAQSMSFQQYATQFWCDDQRWQKPLSNMGRLEKVIDEVSKLAGEVMAFEDSDHAILKSIIESPYTDQQGNMNLPRPLIHRQLKPFESTILNASEKKPK